LGILAGIEKVAVVLEGVLVSMALADISQIKPASSSMKGVKCRCLKLVEYIL